MDSVLRIRGDPLWESLSRLGEIGAYRDERTGLTGVNRLALTAADGQGRRLVMRWFEEAGLDDEDDLSHVWIAYHLLDGSH